MKKRKQHSPEKKAEIVIRVLKEEETLAQIASEYGIHPNQVTRWKQQFLKDHHIAISMDGKGRAIDTIFTERFFRSLKYEEVYPKEYGTPREARSEIRGYMKFYNYERPHQSLCYQPPAQYYQGLGKN